MAAGQPFLASDIDEWLYHVLSGDAFLQEYAPGGFWASHPDRVTNVEWSADLTYSFYDVANGSDGYPYRSLINDNVGNDPTSSPTAWVDCFPCIRWWVQSQGRDLKRQDGRAGRVESAPKVVVCIVDRQRGGGIDRVGGTLGTLKAAQLRLVTLLDARNEMFTLGDGRTSQFTAFELSAYDMTEPTIGDYSLCLGHWYQLRVQ